MIADWPTRRQAEALRQWPTLLDVSERAANMPELDGVRGIACLLVITLLGSFAAGTADDLSDVDLVAVVVDGRFRAAWERRSELETTGALVSWDDVDNRDPGAGAHKWLTRDLVKVECTIADPSRGGMKLAEPCAVIVGDPALVERFPRIPAIPVDVLDRYAQQLREEGRVPEVEMHYGELKEAVRAALRENPRAKRGSRD